MSPFLSHFLGLVEIHGEWMLFLLAVGETSFVTGLVVPSGVATSVATLLAMEGHLSLPGVALAALAGGWVGDTMGFWIGRAGGDHLAAGEGRFAGLYRKRRREADRIFGGHPFVSVTVARWVSFVRTIMPMAAGMSRLGYRRFLVFEAFGLLGWLFLYMALGYLTQESWEVASRILGVGGALAFGVVALVLWRLARRVSPRRTA